MMTCFVPAKSFPKKLVREYRHLTSYRVNPIKFHFKKEIYLWCCENKIYYRRVGKPIHGFIFENEADVMAIKLRWL